ncbi:MAG: hypothetical protein J7L94_09020 [Caldisericaceae bacterium]|nr:hypothetical protein [Caldisericaceae bacterium]
MLSSRSLIVLIILSSLILFSQCGKNPESEGDEAYAKGKYNQALTYYLKVKKEQPDNARINEKIALTYMQRGLALYKLRKNVDAFQLNYEKSREFLPDTLSDHFKKEFSKLLYELALAYHNAVPKNDIQKEKYFTLTLDYLKKALEFDSTNVQADSKLNEIKIANYQRYFDRGKDFYLQAKRDKRNPSLYLSAEAYLLQAIRLNPESEEAQKLLKKVRQKTMAILDISDELPLALAITGQKWMSGNLALSVTVFNNTVDPYTIDPQRFTLYDRVGKTYKIAAEPTAEFSKGLVEPTVIDAKKDGNFVLAFQVPRGLALDKLIYETEDGYTIGKYFP